LIFPERVLNLLAEAENADEALDVLWRSAVDGVHRYPNAGNEGRAWPAERVRLEWPQLKIVLASGHLQMSSDLVADGDLAKPYLDADLVTCLRGLLEDAQ
jgi:hypothetical protein